MLYNGSQFMNLHFSLKLSWPKHDMWSIFHCTSVNIVFKICFQKYLLMSYFTNLYLITYTKKLEMQNTFQQCLFVYLKKIVFKKPTLTILQQAPDTLWAVWGVVRGDRGRRSRPSTRVSEEFPWPHVRCTWLGDVWTIRRPLHLDRGGGFEENEMCCVVIWGYVIQGTVFQTWTKIFFIQWGPML